MTDHDAASETHVAEHATDSHMDARTTLSDDDHGHAEDALGPIDWGAWVLAAVGAVSGVMVLVGFLFAVS